MDTRNTYRRFKWCLPQNICVDMHRSELKGYIPARDHGNRRDGAPRGPIRKNSEQVRQKTCPEYPTENKRDQAAMESSRR